MVLTRRSKAATAVRVLHTFLFHLTRLAAIEKRYTGLVTFSYHCASNSYAHVLSSRRPRETPRRQQPSWKYDPMYIILPVRSHVYQRTTLIRRAQSNTPQLLIDPS
jgi:hypothetical protein